ncbi:hypothetical protein A2U01_0082589, partial [Trifolium medium]|nr:hypothetical protein [Trifolium medium]
RSTWEMCYADVDEEATSYWAVLDVLAGVDLSQL